MKRLSKMAPLALSALALAVALSACGGDDAGSASDAGTDTGFDFDTDYPYDLDAGLRCDGGVDVMQPSPDGVGEIPTGIEHCPDDSFHRYTTVPCTEIEGTVDDGCDEDECDGCPPTRVCVEVPDQLQPCRCVTPCASDADCAPDEACMCTFAGAAYCESADCRTDADCGELECGLSFDPNCGGLEILGCHTPSDECHGDAQCEPGDSCVYAGYAPWECAWWAECD